MRSASVIILTLLVHLGLFGRVVGDGPCCPVTSLEHSHAHDHDSAATGHSHGDCTGDHDPCDGDNCPPDCGEHHHHHGTCFHSVQLSLTADAQCGLVPPHAISLGCEWQHLRIPDGPVMELDKPPLI